MPVNYQTPVASQLKPVRGVRLGIAQAAIRKLDRKDLLLIELAAGARVAGVFTRNRFCAAPVQVCQRHLGNTDRPGEIRALLINTGVANAGTGEPGWLAARATCVAVAQLLSLQPEQVLPFSTGVILEPLPVERIEAGLPACIADLGADHWFEAAHAIMTTDTVAKAASRQIDIGGRTITITGIAKGAGMIRPNMATMLGFVATDAAVSQAALARMVREAADESFNCVTVDGDIDDHRAGWRNAKHAQQWENTLTAYAYPTIGDKPPGQITTADVLTVLKPIWTDKAETASRVRNRIELVIDAARAQGLSDASNPATWRGHLDKLLQKRTKASKGHHAAMDYNDLPAFFGRLKNERDSLSSQALQLTILTAVRTSEALLAKWEEFDLSAKLWTIPAERMKAEKAHRVPLSDAAMDLIESQPDRKGYIFPGAKIGKPLSNMAMAVSYTHLTLPTNREV